MGHTGIARIWPVSYTHLASLLVALTVVPTMGSVLLRKTKDVKQPWFDKIKDVYGKVLELALRFKIIPVSYTHLKRPT